MAVRLRHGMLDLLRHDVHHPLRDAHLDRWFGSILCDWRTAVRVRRADEIASQKWHHAPSTCMCELLL